MLKIINFFKSIKLLIGLILTLFSAVVFAQSLAQLESPSPNAFIESGVGLIRGWVCDAERVEVSIDGEPPRLTAYGTKRGDTEAVCGDSDNGFGLTFPWYQIGDGLHNLRAFADGVEFANINFVVSALAGDFLVDLSGEYRVPDFPGPGSVATIRWSEPHQNFVFARARSIPANPDPPSLPRAQLESPGQGSFESGIGLIRGWVCEATQVTVSIDGEPPRLTAYGTKRGDTEAVCGDTDNGFGLTFPWYQLGDGVHNLRAFADGVAFADVDFAVTTVASDFLQDVDGQFTLADFPNPDQTTTVRWSEPDQNFTIAKTTATPPRLAAISAIQAVTNFFGVVGVGVDSTDTTGIRMAKDARGEPTQLQGITWADTATGQAADLELSAEGAPTFYTDSSGVQARVSEFTNTDTTATITFLDSGGNPQAPVTLEIDNGPFAALLEIVRQIEVNNLQAARLPSASPVPPAASASPTADPTRPRLSLSALRTNSYWYGSWAGGELLCIIQQAALTAGVRDLVAPTACQSPLIRGFRERANALRSLAVVPESGIDPLVQQALQFEADATDTACDPDTDPTACLTQPAQELQDRTQTVEPPIPSEPPEPPGPVVPPAPNNVQASDGLFMDRVQITWSPATGATFYQVYRSDSANNAGMQIGQSTDTRFDDTSVGPEVVHWYAVQACNNAGCGSLSSADSGFTQPQIVIPNPPTGVAASDGAFPDRVRVTWSAVAGATSYEVYRSNSADGGGTRINALAGTAFEDLTVTSGVTYWYSVTACNSAGCSGLSSADSGFAQVSIQSGLWSGSDPVIQFFVASDGKSLTSLTLGPVEVSGCSPSYTTVTFSGDGSNIPVTDSRFSYSAITSLGITLQFEGSFSSPTTSSGTYQVGGEDTVTPCSPQGSGNWSAAPSR